MMMVVILSLINLLITCWFVYKTIFRQELDFFLWGGLLVAFAMPAVFDSINAYGVDAKREELLVHAVLIAIGFNVLYWSMKEFIVGKVKVKYLPDAGVPVPDFVLPLLTIVLLAGVLLLIVHVVIIFSVSFDNIVAAFSLNWRDVSLDNSTIYRDLAHRFLIVGSASVVLAFYQKKYLWVVVALLLVFMAVLIEGVRYLLAPTLLPVIFYIIASKFRWRNIVTAGFSALIVLFIIYHVQTLRYQNDRSIINLASPENIVITWERLLNVGGDKNEAQGEFRLRGFYYFLLNDMPDNHNFSWGQTYRRLVLLPFPTSMLQGVKPTEYTKDIANYIYPEREGYGGTVHPLIYGESYANFGNFSIFVGMFWGVVYGFLILWFRKRAPYMRIILLAPVSIFGIFLARGAVYSSAIFLVYGVILMIALTALFEKISKVRWSLS